MTPGHLPGCAARWGGDHCTLECATAPPEALLPDNPDPRYVRVFPEPNRSGDMVLRDGDQVQLTLLVLEGFANRGEPFTANDALRVAATIRAMDEAPKGVLITSADVRRVLALHYGRNW